MKKLLAVSAAVALALFLVVGTAYSGTTTDNTAQQQQQQQTQQSMVGGVQSMNSSPSVMWPYAANGVPYPQVGGYWSPLIMPDGNTHKASELLHLQDVIPAFVAEELASQPGGKVTTQLVSFIPPGESSKPTIIPAACQVIVTKPANQEEEATFHQMYQLVGINLIKGDSETSSFKILGRAIADGLKIGADTMEYVEGASLDMCASSWGIGINNSLSVVSLGASSGIGNVAAGGIGYTKAHAGYVSKPWMNVQYFKKRTGVSGFYSPSSRQPVTPAAGTLEMYPGSTVLQVKHETIEPQSTSPLKETKHETATPKDTVAQRSSGAAAPAPLTASKIVPVSYGDFTTSNSSDSKDSDGSREREAVKVTTEGSGN